MQFQDKRETHAQGYRIVLGVRDDTVRQKLLENRKLTLASCIEVCRAHESSHLQAKAIMSGTPGVVDRVNQRKNTGTTPAQHKKCKKCGRSHKPQDLCPARDAKCYKCSRKGHYAAMCYSWAGKSGEHKARSQRDVVSDVTEQSVENAFLGTVSKTMETEAWHVHVFMENQRVCFKMDTGADVTVIPDTAPKVYERTVWPWPKLAASVGLQFEDGMQGCCYYSGCIRCEESA